MPTRIYGKSFAGVEKKPSIVDSDSQISNSFVCNLKNNKIKKSPKIYENQFHQDGQPRFPLEEQGLQIFTREIR